MDTIEQAIWNLVRIRNW